MIFQTLNQTNIFFIFMFFGAIFGLFALFCFSFFLINFKKKIKKNIIKAVFYSIFSGFFVILLFFFNFGKFSLTLLFAFICGYIWIKHLTRNLLVILQNKWYNILNKTFTYHKEGKFLKNEQSEKS